MPDIYFDVDAALSEVPVNIFPLTDDTDFKTRETAVAYNAAGMDLVWNFVTSAGAYTQTAVTPTTAGTYDWAHQGDGMYSIEIPASAGASINNDTEGYGWFTGIATGVLPWRSPTFGFRAAAINDSLCDTNTTGLLAPTTAGRTLDVASTGEAGLDFANVNIPVGQVAIAQILDNGTMQSGSTASTAVLRSAFAAGADDRIVGATIWITGGTGANQRRLIHDSVNSTDTVSVAPDWDTTPDNTSTYIVYPTPPASTNSAIALPTLAQVNATRYIKNTANQKIGFTLVSSTDHVTRQTGITVTAQRSLDGASWTSATGSVVEIGSGAYYLNTSAADTNADDVFFRFTGTGCDPNELQIVTAS